MCEYVIKIREISLLTANEYDHLRHLIPAIHEKWWLRTEGEFLHHAAYVDCRGDINLRGEDVLNSSVGVRPNIRVDMSIPIEGIGSKIKLFGFIWTLISDELGYMAICDDIIARHHFDSFSYYYGLSDIKDWLDEWAEFLSMGLDDVIYDPDVPF